jgi:hypothetical protein
MYEFITMFGPRVRGAATAELEDAMVNDWHGLEAGVTWATQHFINIIDALHN